MKDSSHFKNITNLPLSSNQMRIWIVSQHNKLNPAYNLSLTYHFKGEINYEIFRKSIDVLFNKQYTIFSVFKQKNGEPYIEIIKRDFNVEFIDFSEIPSNKRKETILTFAGEDSRKCFDIENGPLYRLYLLKYDATSYFFHLTIHHLIFDGRSVKIFVNGISRIYTDLCMGKVEEQEVSQK